MQLRKIALCVEAWWSEENHFAWNFTRKRLLQEGQTGRFVDRVYVVHVHTKGREVENWDKGTPVLGDVRTELALYDHFIAELHGELVSSVVRFLSDEGIDIAILSLKDQNRVKKTLSMGTAHQILAKAKCACTVVSPKFSAGDHFRIQAKLQPDALVTNSALQYRRRVAVVLNSALWDSALTQYVAQNVILPGDRVILVRCLNENMNKKSAEELQIERDYLRELGWHEFKRTHAALAVEVIKNNTRVLSDFIEEKGIDLLLMARSDSNKLKRSIKKDNVSFQTFPHKSPCPFMIVPTAVLRQNTRFFAVPAAEEASQSSPFWIGGNGLFSRKTWSAALQAPHFRIFGHGTRRCLSMDSSDQNTPFPGMEYLKRDDSIELSSTAIDQRDYHSFRSSENLMNAGASSDAPDLYSSAPDLQRDEASQRDAVLRRLQKLLSEKEKEIVALKQRIRHLQSL